MTAAPHSSAAELPVRTGEAPWTDAELAELRIELEKEAAALRAEHELAISNNTRELLEQTEHALDRIEAGTYGVCESCGKPIGKARLQAFPRATLCVACKQRQERR